MAWPDLMHVRQVCLRESKFDKAQNRAKLPPSNQDPSRYAILEIEQAFPS